MTQNIKNPTIDLNKKLKDVPFQEVIQLLYGVEVKHFDRNDSGNLNYLDKIRKAMRETCRKVQANPIKRSRPNEVGNDMEPFVIDALKKQGLNAAPPKTKSGKGKSTGYPDIKITLQGLPIFLEVKTYNAENHETTFRSFFVSPSDDPKVNSDGYHLAVGFEIENQGGLYSPVRFYLVDLYGLKCDLKAEFNSDNSRLYEQDRRLASERV